MLGFGTWSAFGAGRVPVGFNASDPLFDSAEETGGSKDAIVVSHTHTGSTGSAGNHTHNIWGDIRNDLNSSGRLPTCAQAGLETYVQTEPAGDHTHSVTISTTGSSGTNANLPPYITVYMWKRVA